MSDRSDRLARNETMFRSVNERVEEVVQPGPQEEIDFLCECGTANVSEGDPYPPGVRAGPGGWDAVRGCPWARDS